MEFQKTNKQKPGRTQVFLYKKSKFDNIADIHINTHANRRSQKTFRQTATSSEKAMSFLYTLSTFFVVINYNALQFTCLWLLGMAILLPVSTLIARKYYWSIRVREWIGIGLSILLLLVSWRACLPKAQALRNTIVPIEREFVPFAKRYQELARNLRPLENERDEWTAIELQDLTRITEEMRSISSKKGLRDCSDFGVAYDHNRKEVDVHTHICLKETHFYRIWEFHY